jgi:hypothetical protein
MKLENFKNRFKIGFCQAATPFSAKCNLDSELRIQAQRMFKESNANFWDDEITESVCYFTGGVLGLTCVPLDAVKVVLGNVKKTFRLTA